MHPRLEYIAALGLFLVVVATGVQNSVAAATTTSLAPLVEIEQTKKNYFLGVLAGSFFSGFASIFSGFVVLV